MLVSVPSRGLRYLNRNPILTRYQVKVSVPSRGLRYLNEFSYYSVHRNNSVSVPSRGLRYLNDRQLPN